MLTWPFLQTINWQLVGIWVAALLTLVVLSAAFGENLLSRAAFALLIGGAVGYAAAVTWHAVLWPRILLVLRDPLTQWPLLIWFALGLLLLARGLSSGSWLGNTSLAYLVGVGAALAIGGAALGTALPQLTAVFAERGQGLRGPWLGVANTLIVALGTTAVLMRFTYTAQHDKYLVGRLWTGLVRAWGKVGSVFIVVAVGALFATAIISLLTLLTSRLEFLVFDWLRLGIH